MASSSTVVVYIFCFGFLGLCAFCAVCGVVQEPLPFNEEKTVFEFFASYVVTKDSGNVGFNGQVNT